VAVEDQPSGFAMRVALAKLQDRHEVLREGRRRTDVALKVALVTLIWLVSLALLLGWGLTGGPGAERQLAALVAVVLPFVAAVIATRAGYVWLGGAYVVLTLAMVLPALGIAGLA
jgi:hypothetical protein